MFLRKKNLTAALIYITFCNYTLEIPINQSTKKKDYTIIVFMAADNDLNEFSYLNINQMKKIGSNEKINIIVQLHPKGKYSYKKRFFIEKNQEILINEEIYPKKENSGCAETLINCVETVVKSYPSKYLVLILWNHGTGILDPELPKTININSLFFFDPKSKLLKLDRSASFFSSIIQKNNDSEQRGICFDETFKSYINNQELDYALDTLTKKMGKKFDIIAFDACLMAMTEIASSLKKYANIMIASQEVEYGAGWPYDLILFPFLKIDLTPIQFSKHIVRAYDYIYKNITTDYTQSAIDLKNFNFLEKIIDNIASILIEAINLQYNNTVTDILKKCKSTYYCTCFEEPTYIDLGNFLKNILEHIEYFLLTDSQKEASIKTELKQQIIFGLNLLNTVIIENKTGQNLKNATGLSIYFPENLIDKSYRKIRFAGENNWFFLLENYIKQQKLYRQSF